MKTPLLSLLPLAAALSTCLSAESASASTAGSFTVVQSMTQFRTRQTATLLSDGTVLVAGGRPFGPATMSELYDPQNQTWTNSGPLNIGREFHTQTTLTNGRVVVIGGQSANRLLGSTEL